MKITVVKAEKVVQPPDTYLVEFTEQELVDIAAMSSHIGGMYHTSGRKSWGDFSDLLPASIGIKAARLGSKLTNANIDNTPCDVGGFYPDDRKDNS